MRTDKVPPRRCIAAGCSLCDGHDSPSQGRGLGAGRVATVRHAPNPATR